MANNKERKIFIHQNLNKQELRQAVIENNSYSIKPKPVIGEDIGLLYYDYILKSILIWDGSQWRISQFLDDRDLNYGGDVFIEDIWTQTSLIPSSSPSTSPVLEWKSGLTMSNVPNSYNFESSGFIVDNVVPSYKYGQIYEPVLHDVNGAVIPKSVINWKLERGRVTVYSGFETNNGLVIDESNPLFLSYWRYKGNKGNLGGGADTSIISMIGNTFSYTPPDINIANFAYNIQSSDIVSVALNGVLIYDYTFDSISKIITLRELDYELDVSDIVRVEVSV